MSDSEANASGSSPPLRPRTEDMHAATGEQDDEEPEELASDVLAAQLFESVRANLEAVDEELQAAIGRLTSTHPEWADTFADHAVFRTVRDYINAVIYPVFNGESQDAAGHRTALLQYLREDNTDEAGSQASGASDALVGSIAELVASLQRQQPDDSGSPRHHSRQTLVKGATIPKFEGSSAVVKDEHAYQAYQDALKDAIYDFDNGDDSADSLKARLFRLNLTATARAQIEDELGHRRDRDPSLPASHRSLSHTQLVKLGGSAFFSETVLARQRLHFKTIRIKTNEAVNAFIRRFVRSMEMVYPDASLRPPPGDLFDAFVAAMSPRTSLCEHICYQASLGDWSRSSKDSLSRAFKAARAGGNAIRLQGQITATARAHGHHGGYLTKVAAGTFDAFEEILSFSGDEDEHGVVSAGAISGGPRLGPSVQRDRDNSSRSSSSSSTSKGIVVKHGKELLIPGGRTDPQGQSKFEYLWNKQATGHEPGCVYCHKHEIGATSERSSHTILDCEKFQTVARSAKGACLWCARTGHTSASHTGARNRKIDFDYYK